MNLLTTKQFRTYLEMRQRIIPKLVEIQLLETKNPQDIQSLVRDSLLQPIGKQIKENFLQSIKQEQILNLFKTQVLRTAVIPKINPARRQFIFANISSEALENAWASPKDEIVSSILVNLFVQTQAFVRVWANFFAFKISPTGLPRELTNPNYLQCPNEDFWSTFFSGSLVDWLTKSLFPELIEAFSQSNIYLTFNLVNMATLLFEAAQSRGEMAATSPLRKIYQSRADFKQVFYRGQDESQATFETRLNMLALIFSQLRKQSLQKLQDFFEEETSMLEESRYPKGYGSINIRYVGVFDNVKRAMLSIHYMVTQSRQFLSAKTSGEVLIHNSVIKKVVDWLQAVTNAS